MKKRILSVLLLSVMMVGLIMPNLDVEGKNTIIDTETHEVRIIGNNLVEVDTKPEIIETINIEDIEEIAERRKTERLAEISDIEDQKEWFLAYKEIVSDYETILDLPDTIYDVFTKEELDFLFRVVQAEVGDEGSTFEQKVNVARVIFNRLEHENFPDTLNEILTQENQFTVVANKKYKQIEISGEIILACEYAYQIENRSELLFFDCNNTLKYEKVMNDGIHNFYKYWEEDSEWHYLIYQKEE